MEVLITIAFLISVLILAPILYISLMKATFVRSRKKVEAMMAREGFFPNVRIDFPPSKKYGVTMSFLIDENSKRIGLYKLGSTTQLALVNFSEIENVHVKINDTIVMERLYSDYSEYISWALNTYITSIYLYMNTNNLAQPIYKWGIRFKKPLKESEQVIKDHVDWFYKAHAAIKQIIKQYGYHPV